MSDIVIKAENLGKKYVIGHQAERGGYTALRDVLMQNARTLWNKTKDLATGKPIIQGDTMEEVWALKDVSFEIRSGEAVGIIGRNGAGKSTLLKILSRITEPSTGQVTIKGRVTSLLEVGTGFHHELTGRENIYLNGTILGMTRKEIKSKFDEIVAFAEVEKYLDTPVKRYSSGMYVRLAFAVAAHLEPEILLVDEVLAVGDAAFQKKCLGKMGEVAKVGRTVLFVSHNMSAIQNLCKTCILLDNGKFIERGDSKSIVSKYIDLSASRSTDNRQGNELNRNDINIMGFHFEDFKGNLLTQLIGGESCRIFIHFKCQNSLILKKVQIHLFIRDMHDNPLFNLNNRLTAQLFETVTGEGFFICDVPCMPLAPGEYALIAGISKGIIHEWLIKPELFLGKITMAPGDFFGTGWAGSSAPVLVSHSWRLKHVENQEI